MSVRSRDFVVLGLVALLALAGPPAGCLGAEVHDLEASVRSLESQLVELVLRLRGDLEGLLLEIRSGAGGILGSIGQAATSVDDTGPNLPEVWVLTLLAMSVVATMAFFVQNSYVRETSSRPLSTLFIGLGLARGVPPSPAEVVASLSQPFWDPLPSQHERRARRGATSPIDEEYLRTLFRLGYADEARRIIEGLEAVDVVDSRPSG